MIVLLLAAIAGAAGAAWYYWYGRWYETTDNAYLTGNMVEVGSEIQGTVVWIGPEANDRVHQGQEILRLAEGDERENLALRKHELGLAVQEVLTLRAEVSRLEAELRLRGITHQLADQELRRRERLYPKNMVSKEELDSARTREAETRVGLDTARLALEKARVQAGSQALEDHPRVRASAAHLRSAFRDWRKTHIVAPITGEVARRRAQAGQRVSPGTPLFTLVERDRAWVEANFKETQLRHLRPGQPVTLSSDLYGSSMTFEGRVGSIGTGTGSVFSLLPPQNATGNWIKIVQRVPVRIELDGGFDQDHPLPFGASLQARVDTRDRSGPLLLAGSDSEPAAQAEIYGYQDEGVDELIAQVIATHSEAGNQGE
jgi:membrane fusion protein (multidrug efflux system)